MKMIWHFVHRTMPGSREPYQLVLHALLLLNHLLRIYSDFDIKLSATGLVYRHYGKDVIFELYPALKSEPAKVRLRSVLYWILLLGASIFASLSVGHGCVAAQATSPEKKRSTFVRVRIGFIRVRSLRSLPRVATIMPSNISTIHCT